MAGRLRRRCRLCGRLFHAGVARHGTCKSGRTEEKGFLADGSGCAVNGGGKLFASVECKSADTRRVLQQSRHAWSSHLQNTNSPSPLGLDGIATRSFSYMLNANPPSPVGPSGSVVRRNSSLSRMQVRQCSLDPPARSPYATPRTAKRKSADTRLALQQRRHVWLFILAEYIAVAPPALRRHCLAQLSYMLNANPLTPVDPPEVSSGATPRSAECISTDARRTLR